MNAGKQKYFTLINEEDDTIFCIIKSISTNNFEDVIQTINFSEDWLKYRNVNISEEQQIINFHLFGKEVTEFSGTDQEWEDEIEQNFDTKYQEFVTAKIQLSNEAGLNSFNFVVGQSYTDFETMLQDFADEYGYVLTNKLS